MMIVIDKLKSLQPQVRKKTKTFMSNLIKRIKTTILTGKDGNCSKLETKVIGFETTWFG